MNKKDYLNSVTMQVMDLSNLAQVQADLCFNLDKLSAMLSKEEAQKVKRIIITGCGDSYSAAGAMLPGMKSLTGLRKINSPDIMDFIHYYSEIKIKKGYDMSEVLVMSISASGSAPRVAQALERANELGAMSLLITKTPDSRGGRAAQKVFNLETPDGLNTPGLRSYYASMIGIAAISAYIGLCNGNISEERFFEVKNSIVAYTLSVLDRFDAIDDLMFSVAEKMKDLKLFEIIADWNEGYSAQFIEQKFIECSGCYAHHFNSEEFVHIPMMLRAPWEYGEIFLINEDDVSFSRMKNTILGSRMQKRITVVVTDAEPELFAVEPMDGRPLEDAIFCRLPKAPEAWMSVLMDFVPGSLLAGYHAALNEIFFFNRSFDFRACKRVEK